MLPGAGRGLRFDRKVEVLVEGPSKRSAGNHEQLTGRTMTDHIAVFDGPLRLIGRTVSVRVEDASSFTLYGQVETTESVGVLHRHETAPSETRRRIGLTLV